MSAASKTKLKVKIKYFWLIRTLNSIIDCLKYAYNRLIID